MFWVLFGLLIIGAAYLAIVAWDAKHDVKDAPRTDMFLCERHGAIPSKYVLKLEGMTKEPILRCPICFEDSFKTARKQFE